MKGGDSASTPAAGFPAPSGGGAVSSVDTGAPGTSPSAGPTTRTTASPVLPEGTATEPATIATSSTQPKTGSDTWYRSDHERTKSVRRRANPWYRRFGRMLVALTVVAAVGSGLYLGARAVQDYTERDRLPSAGAEVPEIRATSFQIRSSAPAPQIDGTLTIDTSSGAFEFIGRNGGPQTDVQAVSTGLSSVYIRSTGGDWRLAQTADELASDLQTAVRYLSNDDTADAILTSRVRRGYVELQEQATEGIGDNEITRYELEIDTEQFGADYPLQWQEFESGAIPGVGGTTMLPVIIWLDTESVLVRVRDEQTNWSWERLTYADTPFTPDDPASTLLDATTDADATEADATDGDG